jgi:hypothetical protein
MAGSSNSTALKLDSLCLLGHVAISDKYATRFTIPSGESGVYRVAQLDDYSNLSRKNFTHSHPISFALNARVSASHLPGTWGFGFWNDPFALGIGVKGSGIRLPALPQAAWFFYGSPQNDLSFQSKTAANGLFAGVFSSAGVPSLLLPLALPGILLLPIKPAARLIRRLASRFIHDEYRSLGIDPTEWHSYQVDWLCQSVQFRVDNLVVFSSRLNPWPPMGLVIWIDNQYAAFSADGKVRFGMEANPEPAWMEINNVVVSKLGSV